MSWFVCAEGQEAALAMLEGGPRARIDAESCDALVWFSDLAGFSAMAASCNAAEVASRVREVMTIQESAILYPWRTDRQVHGRRPCGVLAKCRERRTGLRTRTAPSRLPLACATDVVDLFQQRGVPCDMRIGLHAGDVFIGDLGGNDRIAFTPVGQAVNDASRYEQAVLCDSGRPFGRVRLSAPVLDHIRDVPRHASFNPIARTFSDKHRRHYRSWSSIDRAHDESESDMTAAKSGSM